MQMEIWQTVQLKHNYYELMTVRPAWAPTRESLNIQALTMVLAYTPINDYGYEKQQNLHWVGSAPAPSYKLSSAQMQLIEQLRETPAIKVLVTYGSLDMRPIAGPLQTLLRALQTTSHLLIAQHVGPK